MSEQTHHAHDVYSSR